MARKLKSMDGNQAAAHVSYAFTEVAAITSTTAGGLPKTRVTNIRVSTIPTDATLRYKDMASCVCKTSACPILSASLGYRKQVSGI